MNLRIFLQQITFAIEIFVIVNVPNNAKLFS